MRRPYRWRRRLEPATFPDRQPQSEYPGRCKPGLLRNGLRIEAVLPGCPKDSGMRAVDGFRETGRNGVQDSGVGHPRLSPVRQRRGRACCPSGGPTHETTYRVLASTRWPRTILGTPERVSVSGTGCHLIYGYRHRNAGCAQSDDDGD